MNIHEAFRFAEAMAHIFGHRTATDDGLAWATEIDAKLARGEDIGPTYTADELIAHLNAAYLTNSEDLTGST